MYGQYSETGGFRRTKNDMVAHLPCGYRDARKAGHNRLIWTDAEGGRHYRLHRTDVVSVSPDGWTMTLADGGYATMTTRRAMAQGMAALVPAAAGKYWGVYGNKGRDSHRPHFLHASDPRAGGAFSSGAAFDLSDGYPVLLTQGDA